MCASRSWRRGLARANAGGLKRIGALDIIARAAPRHARQQAHWLPRLCSSEAIGAIGMTVGNSSDGRCARTRGAGRRLRDLGAKAFTNGQNAGLVLSPPDRSGGARGVACWWTAAARLPAGAI
jgi:alkylation response protein AidB-like acyl-CoA dehydrogenase